MSSRYLLWALALALALVPMVVGCSRAVGEEEHAPPPFVLSSDEIQTARNLAEKEIPVDPSSESRLVYIKTELLPESQAESFKRQVLVTHYQYHGDATFLAVVDLKTHLVVKVDHETHFPTALAAEEVRRAEELARRDARLTTLLASAEPRVRLEARPFQTTQSGNALFGHRVVEFHLLRGDENLRHPIVRVDLTNETVHVE